MLVNLMAFPGANIHNTADPKFELGSISIVGDRVWRYVKATEAITAGNFVTATAPSQVSNITGFSNTTDEVLGVYPYVEDTGESMTANYYQGCYLYLSGNTGVGLMKRIRSNTATRIYVEAMYPELGEGHAFSTSPDVTTDYNIISPWHVKVCAANTVVATGIGWAPYAFTIHYYGWVLVSGVGNPTGYGTGVIDTLVTPGGDTAGEVAIATTSQDLADATPCGIALFAGATNAKWPVLFRGIGL